MRTLSGLCLIWWLCQVSGETKTYRGAVVEYHPVLGSNEEIRVASNVANYVDAMKLAKEQEADIIVFPENGLLTKSIWSPIPDPVDRIAPCDSETFATTEAVKNLSCASKNNRIYSVVNLLEKRPCKKDDKQCPSRGYYVHNTNVGFDRNGVVVARYSKFNLYDEPLTNKTERPEMVFFDTDFNVRFGMFTCFDILFPTPALKLISEYNVTDFLYTTHWYSELPFLTALQVQRGWAETNNVNLLASGVNYPPTGTFGSGIYNGKFGDLVQIMPEAVTRKVIVSDVPVIGAVEETTKVKRRPAVVVPLPGGETETATTDDAVELMRDHMQLFRSEVLETGKRFEKKICSGNDFCCDFRVSATSLSSSAADYTLRAVVFDGVRKFGASFGGGVQCCGIVVCRGPEIMNCTNRVKNIPGIFKFQEIRLTGNFQSGDSFQIPSTLTDGEQLEPLTANKYSFKKQKKGKTTEASLELIWPVTNLQTFGIWGRDFSRDMKSSAVVHTPGLFAAISLLAWVIAYSI